MAIRQALDKLLEAGIEISDETIALVTGGLDVSRLKSESDSLYKKYGASGNVPHRPEEREEQFDELQQQLSRVGLRTGAAFLGLKQIQDKYQYEKVPAFQAAAKVGSDFTEKMMAAMQVREQMRLEYTQMAHNMILGVAAASHAYRLVRSVRDIGLAKSTLEGAAGVRRGIRTLGIVRTGVNVLRKVKNAGAAFAGFLAAPFTGTASIWGSIGAAAALDVAFVAAGHVAEGLVAAIGEDRFNEAYQNTFAGSLLDAGILSDFEKRRRFMPDFDFEDVKDIQSRTRLYGATEEAITTLAGYAENRIANADKNDYAERMYMDSKFFGVGEDSITSIYTSIGNIGGGNKPVEQAQSEFQRFFAAVGSSVAPSVAEIEMVRELSSFAENYSFATKMVMDISALANIQGFMSRAGVGNMMTTAPTQNLVKGLDKALTGAAGATNVSMMRFNARYDISMSESLQGITSNSDTLNKFLGGISTELGLSSGNGITEENSIRMYRMLNAMGVDKDSVQVVMRVMPGYLRGERVRDVGELDAFSEQREEDTESSLLRYYQSLSDDDLRTLEININRVDLAIEVAETTMDAYIDRFLEVMATFGDLAETAKSAVDGAGSSVVTPSTRNLDRTSPIVRQIFRTNPNVTFGPGINSEAVRNFINNNPNYEHVVRGAQELGVRPEDLAAIIGFETMYSFSPAEQRNTKSTATGLIQFLEGTAGDLGTTTDELKNMTFEEQMEYVVEYLRRYKVGRKYSSLVDMYIAIVQPARLGEDVILSDPDKVAINKVLDVDGDGRVTRSDLHAIYGGSPDIMIPNNIVINLDTYEFTADDMANEIIGE